MQFSQPDDLNDGTEPSSGGGIRIRIHVLSYQAGATGTTDIHADALPDPYVQPAYEDLLHGSATTPIPAIRSSLADKNGGCEKPCSDSGYGLAGSVAKLRAPEALPHSPRQITGAPEVPGGRPPEIRNAHGAR